MGKIKTISIEGIDNKLEVEFGYRRKTLVIHFGNVDDETVRNAKIAIKDFLDKKDWKGYVGVIRTGSLLSIQLMTSDNVDDIVFN